MKTHFFKQISSDIVRSCRVSLLALLALLCASSFALADVVYSDTDPGNPIPTTNIVTGSNGVGNVTFDITEVGDYTKVMSGSGKVTKIGDGTLTLSGANTFSGGIAVEGGALKVTSGVPGTGKISNNHGEVEFAVAENNTITITCDVGNYNGSKTIKTGAGTLSTNHWISGNVEVLEGRLKITSDFGSGKRFNGKITISKDATLECASHDSLGRGEAITTMNLYGKLYLSTTNSNETLRDIQLHLYGGTIESKSTNGSTLDIRDTGVKFYSHALAGATATNPTISTVSSNIRIRIDENPKEFVIDTDAKSQINITGVMSNTSDEGIGCKVIKQGDGTLLLSARNTFKGGLTISEGKVIANAANASASTFGTGAISIASGATLEFQVSNQLGTSSPNDITIKGTLIPSNFTHVKNITLENGVIEREYGYTASGSGLDFKDRTATIKSTGNSNIKSRLALRSGSKVTINVPSDNLTIDGVIYDAAGFTKTGVGTLTLSGANTYKGTTTVSEGVLELTGAAIVANGPTTVEDNGTLVYNLTEGTKKLTIGAANKIFSTGQGQIKKTGDGVLQINAAQGAVDAQSLVVSSGRLDMMTYFKGTLTVGEQLDAENYSIATFSPGNSVGELNVDGNLILNPGSTLLMEIGGQTADENDKLIVSGNLTLQDGSVLYLALADDNHFSNGDNFLAQIVAETLTLNGETPGEGDVTSLFEEYLVIGWPFYDLSVTREGNIYSIKGSYDPNAVPEPSTWALLALGVIVLYLRKRVRS